MDAFQVTLNKSGLPLSSDFAEMTASASLRQLEWMTPGINITSRQNVMVTMTGNTTDRGPIVFESHAAMNALLKPLLWFLVADGTIHFGQLLCMRKVPDIFQVSVTADTSETRSSMD
jgi:hypothetical protein